MKKKLLVIGLFLCVAGTAAAQLPKLLKAGRQAGGRAVTRVPVTRVPGANIQGLSVGAQRWGEVYRLNENYLQDLKKTAVQFPKENIRGIETTHIPAEIKRYFQESFTPERSVPTVETLFLKEAARLEKRVKTLDSWPQKGQEALASASGSAVYDVLAEKLSKEKLVLVGEIHGQAAPRNAIAAVLKKVHALEPKRKIILFAESLYLKPVEKEAVFPYVYARSEKESLDQAFDRNDPTSPNARILEAQHNFREMFDALHEIGVEIYPVEDAVVAQKLSAQGRISTVMGLAERNRGFARAIRTQMEQIRAKNPDALFVFYGGMSHVSWSMPYSIPKLFASERPVVVEAVAAADAKRTFSLVKELWGEGHAAFSPAAQEKLFYWKGFDKITPGQWGKTVGFDYRLIAP